MKFPTCSKFGQRHWIVNCFIEVKLAKALKNFKFDFGDTAGQLSRNQKNKMIRAAKASLVRRLVYATLAEWRERFPDIGCGPIKVCRHGLDYIYMRNPITHSYEWRRNNCLDESFVPNYCESLRMIKVFTQNLWNRHEEEVNRDRPWLA